MTGLLKRVNGRVHETIWGTFSQLLPAEWSGLWRKEAVVTRKKSIIDIMPLPQIEVYSD
jgi:hypothetical protein